ncbi:hypothetical protein EYF80_031213 [Liparis tanakae]|uniref:Uncharacterized protein n=1 Tax=Liparis tanakae TaxID=230148 RepID=A0A4Z2H0J2_9TELE|nr:hypothetical protein EYF80_031213 [Liparis tanakae]
MLRGLPLGADEAPQLVAHVAPRPRGGVGVDGGRQVGAVVHCKERKTDRCPEDVYGTTETTTGDKALPPFRMLGCVSYSHLILVMSCSPRLSSSLSCRIFSSSMSISVWPALSSISATSGGMEQ